MDINIVYVLTIQLIDRHAHVFQRRKKYASALLFFKMGVWPLHQSDAHGNLLK
jgi:hypothetical protein